MYDNPSMTDHPPDPQDPAEVFARNLHSLIEQAHRDGVDVEQHWACRSDDATPDWEVEIVRVRPEVTATD